jgi:hypothetical protein
VVAPARTYRGSAVSGTPHMHRRPVSHFLAGIGSPCLRHCAHGASIGARICPPRRAILSYHIDGNQCTARAGGEGAHLMVTVGDGRPLHAAAAARLRRPHGAAQLDRAGRAHAYTPASGHAFSGCKLGILLFGILRRCDAAPSTPPVVHDIAPRAVVSSGGRKPSHKPKDDRAAEGSYGAYGRRAHHLA